MYLAELVDDPPAVSKLGSESVQRLTSRKVELVALALAPRSRVLLTDPDTYTLP